MNGTSAINRNTLCFLLAFTACNSSAYAMTCGEILNQAKSAVSNHVMTPLTNALSLPRQMTAHRLHKKLAGRTYDSFIEENGTRLNLSNLDLNMDDLNYIYEKMKAQGLITDQIRTIKLSYNPALIALHLVPFFKDLAHYTQLTEIDLRDIYVSSKSLEFISNYYPNLQKLRISVFNGRSLRALNNNYKLELLDLSEAHLRNSERSTRSNEELRRPSVSVAELKIFIRHHRRSLKKILLPPVFPTQHEGVFEMASAQGVALVQVPSHLVVKFSAENSLNNRGGLQLEMKGLSTSIFLPSLTLPREGKNVDINEIVVAHHLKLFLKNLAEEGVTGQLVSPMKTIEGTYYGDIYFKREVNGQTQGFLLSNLLSQMRLATPTISTWNDHFLGDVSVWKHLIDLHSQLEDQGAFSAVGSIK